MFRPRGIPNIYQQHDQWHVRIYVPTKLIGVVGKREIHRSLKTFDKKVAMMNAVAEREKQFEWFNRLHENNSTDITIVSELANDEIAEIARSIYQEYRAVVLDEYADSISASAEDWQNQTISPKERASVLKDMLDVFKPEQSAKEAVQLELAKRKLALTSPT